LRRWGTGIGAVAAATMAGLGWTQADKLFPMPGGWGILLAAVVFTLMLIAGAGALFVRLYYAQRRIMIGLEPIGRKQGLDQVERKLVRGAFVEQARMQQAKLLFDVQARADRLDRAAVRLAIANALSPQAKAARTEADRLNVYVGIAQRRVGVAILERRVRLVLGGKITFASLASAALGVAGVFAVSNWASGYRAEHPTPAHKATACIAAVSEAQITDATLAGKLDEACAKLIAP